MTADEVERMIRAGETLDVEFKGEERAHLNDRELVEARGQKRGRSWHLSAAVYRALGAKAAYVRQRGFELLQQEQMVLTLVETHGRITRKEVAELCRLNGPQAYRLLQRLQAKGLLEPDVQLGRGAGYRRRAG